MPVFAMAAPRLATLSLVQVCCCIHCHVVVVVGPRLLHVVVTLDLLWTGIPAVGNEGLH